MRLLVVGGGVAGPAVALAATRLGLAATVLERRAVADPDEGSWVTVAPNGLDALDALGALDDARAIGHPSRLNRMFGATGRHLGDVSLGVPLADGTVALTLKRSALAVMLADAARRQGADVRLGAEVVSVHDDADGARAVLADGSVVEGDLLVAADGVRSGVRRAIDPAAPGARYVGLTNFGGITRGTRLGEHLLPQAWHFVFGRRSFFGAHPLPTGDVVWFANVPRPEIGSQERAATSEEQWLAWLAELVADDAGPASEVVAAGRLELLGRQHLRPPARADLVAGAHRAARGCRPRALAEQRPGCRAGARGRRGARAVRRGARGRWAGGLRASAARPGRGDRQGRGPQQQREDPGPAGPGAARDDPEPGVPLGRGRALDAGVHRAPAGTRPGQLARGVSPRLTPTH